MVQDLSACLEEVTAALYICVFQSFLSLLKQPDADGQCLRAI